MVRAEDWAAARERAAYIGYRNPDVIRLLEGDEIERWMSI